ncbi:MAG TPA: hybrid sensor histidine kinase/response regulator [Flavipsychrobacter sp.]|nr:hybrid sensor histidine kinase/response regulator [Flavipsychrobacter sp.]
MMEEKLKILYVDDEENNLIGFKAAFRMDYNVLTAASAKEGLSLIEEHPDIKIIFCDQRMPETTGVEFFEEISQRFPEPIRMLLTGYVDIQSVVAAINRGHVFRYLTKPWREPDVKSAIEEGYKFYVTNTTLAARNKELQIANAELDKFAYSVTHDLRGPITGLIGAIEIIKESEDLAEIKHLAELMEESAQRANALIYNIHQHYNLNRGILTIAPIDFEGLLEELIALNQVKKNYPAVKLEMEVIQQDVFRSDRTMLQLIINNLLSNALKYQRREEPNKFVSISVKAGKDGAIIEVKDNGIGIAEKYFQSIFQMFFRANSDEAGSGFGLYNVKDAINKLNGDINIASDVGSGTTFTVSIPQK